MNLIHPTDDYDSENWTLTMLANRLSISLLARAFFGFKSPLIGLRDKEVKSENTFFRAFLPLEAKNHWIEITKLFN